MAAGGDVARERREEISGMPTFWREASGAGPPALYLHGCPTSSDDFLPFLERTGGVAPDLPGFGRSGKPADFDYSIAGYGRFLEAFTRHLGLERFSLVVHDWGAVGLALPPPLLERVAGVVVMNAVPLLPGYRWHRVARLWRTPVVGEMTMGFTTRWAVRRALRQAVANTGTADTLTDEVWAHFDHGTQRAILKLYRSASPEALTGAGGRLGSLRCPTLVAWGARDPYIPASFAAAYAGAIGEGARVELIEDAGHWPWLDRPDTVGLVTEFLSAL